MSQPITGDMNRQSLQELISGLEISIDNTLNQALRGEDISIEQAVEI